jgi:hypothetical protein
MANGQVVLVTTEGLSGGQPMRAVYYVAEDDPAKAEAIIAKFMASRASLEAEIIVLRHQLNIQRRKSPKRPSFGGIDRLIFADCMAWRRPFWSSSPEAIFGSIN